MLRKLLWTGLYAGLAAVATMAAPQSRVAALARRDGRGAADEEMTKGDHVVERGAERLQNLSDKAAAAAAASASGSPRSWPTTPRSCASSSRA